MQNIKDGSVATQNDPIWHRLRVELIWYLILGILWLTSAIVAIIAAWNITHNFSFIIYCICPLVLINMAVDRFRWLSYWRRIGQRRDEALHGAQIPAMSLQSVRYGKPLPRLPVPTTFSLRWNKITLFMGGIVVALTAVSWIGLAIVLFEHLDTDDNGLYTLTLVMSVFLTALLIFWAFRYFLFWRHRMQRIEVTEEGIRAYYMRQERFLRWDEIRVFAGYGAQWTGKSSQMQTYEVANEQMVVRWLQSPPINAFFSVQSDLDGKEDWNWLVSRLNIYVADRTGLALLDLSDKTTKRPAS
jgi:hypothetical protein